MVEIMQTSLPLGNTTERPAAIVCIAYRQLSAMLGTKDLTEQPVVQVPLNQDNGAVQAKITDLKLEAMNRIMQLSQEITESFRTIIEDMKRQIQQYRVQNPALFEKFPLSYLPNCCEPQRSLN